MVKPESKCPKCGATLREEDNFCSKCGYRIRKKISPEKLEEVRVKIWMDRIKSFKRTSMVCLISGFLITVSGFSWDYIIIWTTGVWRQPSTRWDFVAGGIVLFVLGFVADAIAFYLERKIEKGELPG